VSINAGSAGFPTEVDVWLDLFYIASAASVLLIPGMRAQLDVAPVLLKRAQGLQLIRVEALFSG